MGQYDAETGNGHAEYGQKKQKKTTEEKVKKCMLDNLILFLLLGGIIVGVVMGIVIRNNHPEYTESKRLQMYLNFPGDLLLRMLKCMIVPLIVSSLISGMASLPSKASGLIGGCAVAYYMLTTFLAVLMGILLVCTIRPGDRISSDTTEERLAEAEDFILDLIRNCFPANIIAATFRQTQTKYIVEDVMTNVTEEDNGTVKIVEKMVPTIMDFTVTTGGGTNVLGLVVFSVTLGIIIGKMGERGLPLKAVFDALTEAIIQIVKLIIWYSPIGIAFLLAVRIIKMKDPAEEFAALGVYMATVIAGLLAHALVILPLIYGVIVRRNPFKMMFHVYPALLTALGTASSSATLPITIECMDERARIPPVIGHFVLPVGATINMDGTALYEAVAVIFISQTLGMTLNVGQTITVAITATAAAIGAAGVPEAGLVTMSVVLTAVGLPLDYIAMIVAVDWLLDRVRTTVNVWGDSVGCGVVHALAKKFGKDDVFDDLLDEDDEDESSSDGIPNKGYMIDNGELKTAL